MPFIFSVIDSTFILEPHRRYESFALWKKLSAISSWSDFLWYSPANSQARPVSWINPEDFDQVIAAAYDDIASASSPSNACSSAVNRWTYIDVLGRITNSVLLTKMYQTSVIFNKMCGGSYLVTEIPRSKGGSCCQLYHRFFVKLFNFQVLWSRPIPIFYSAKSVEGSVKENNKPELFMGRPSKKGQNARNT